MGTGFRYRLTNRDAIGTNRCEQVERGSKPALDEATQAAELAPLFVR